MTGSDEGVAAAAATSFVKASDPKRGELPCFTESAEESEGPSSFLLASEARGPRNLELKLCSNFLTYGLPLEGDGRPGDVPSLKDQGLLPLGVLLDLLETGVCGMRILT